MYSGNYSLSIPEGKEHYNGDVVLKHNQNYSVRLNNSNNTRCDVNIEIDGKDIGTFRIEKYSSITIERPVNDNGKFTFLKIGSKEFDIAGLNNVPNDRIGIVRATFTPEMEIRFSEPVYSGKHTYPSTMLFAASRDQITCSSFDSMDNRGGTGLSGESDQRFIDAKHLILDHNKQVIMQLRLVSKSVASNKIRALKSI